MVDLQVATLTGANAVLEDEVVEEFRKRLRGKLVLPGDEDYDSARTVWNAMINRRPALIVRCAGVSDVIESVNLARDNNLLLAVRGGGHSFAGNSVCDGGIVIDLSRMQGVRVDPAKQTVRAEGGVLWIDFDIETQAFGLATTGGTNSDTGIAGLTLGGGHGWLGGKYGLSLDNLLSVDIVTADGQFRTASTTENSELFWAVRGGGGNFGVVTSFEYQLHPVGTLLAGMLIHPFSRAKEVFTRYRDFMRDCPNELTSMAGFLTSQEGEPAAAMVVCYNGDIQNGERLLEPLRKFGPPLADTIGPMPYTSVQVMIDGLTPAGRQNYEKAHFLADIGDGAIDTMIDSFSRVTSPFSAVILQHIGGEMQRGAGEGAAYSQRDALYNLIVFSAWLDQGESEVHIKWNRDLWEAMKPHTTGGVYVNDIGREVEEGADMMRSAYGASYPRLVALKNEYDPKNLFRHNQNIKPTV